MGEAEKVVEREEEDWATAGVVMAVGELEAEEEEVGVEVVATEVAEVVGKVEVATEVVEAGERVVVMEKEKVAGADKVMGGPAMVPLDTAIREEVG